MAGVRYNDSMLSKSKKFEIAIFFGVLIVLGVVWMMNGYEDTWLYATAAIIAVPANWLYFRQKRDGQEK